jgi:hypothetical protein
MSDNGEQRDARLGRLEQEHEEFQRDLKMLLTAQVIQKDQIDQLLKAIEIEGKERREKDATLEAQNRALDQRVDNLVSSIADLIRRIPPESLR